MLVLILPIFALVLTTIADQSRVIGGQNANQGQFPYQVSIRKSNKHFCGGSIMDEHNILTTAACVDGLTTEDMTVVVGSISLNNSDFAYNVIDIKIHKDFDSRIRLNDVALVKTTEPIKFTDNVKPIARTAGKPADNKTMVLSGWGSYKEDGFPDTLQYIYVSILNLQSCSSQLNGDIPLTHANLCTTSPVGEGACLGDAGGPLVDMDGYQIGIRSWGISCGTGRPDVYMAVGPYYMWITLNL